MAEPVQVQTDKEQRRLIRMAETISKALPYMRRHNDATFVVKYGGHAMGNEEVARAFARDIVLLEQTAINPVVVHGGGPQIEAMLKRAGVESQFAGGLRITHATTLEIVEMVLAGSIMGGDITAAVRELREHGVPVIALNMAGSVTDAADLVVSDPVQAGTMAVMAIADTAQFDLARLRGRRY